jgi:hypothetical protein
MIPALETVGFFLAMAVALQFSSWAEGWLAASPRPIRVRESNTTSIQAADFQDSSSVRKTAPAA